jgi:hypothetical protein
VKAAGGKPFSLSNTNLGTELDAPVIQDGKVTFLAGETVYMVEEGQTFASAVSVTYNTGYSYPSTAVPDPVDANVFFIAQAEAAPQSFHLFTCPVSDTGCSLVGSPTPIVIAMSTMTPSDLFVNQTDAFWINTVMNPTSTSISRYTFVTNTITTIPTLVSHGLTFDASNIYWDNAGSIYSMPQSFSTSTTPQVVPVPVSVSGSLAADGTNLYFGSAATVSYVPVGGGSPTVIYTSPNPSGANEQGLIAAGGAVFWTDENVVACPPTANIMGIAAP